MKVASFHAHMHEFTFVIRCVPFNTGSDIIGLYRALSHLVITVIAACTLVAHFLREKVITYSTKLQVISLFAWKSVRRKVQLSSICSILISRQLFNAFQYVMQSRAENLQSKTVVLCNYRRIVYDTMAKKLAWKINRSFENASEIEEKLLEIRD